MIILLFSVMYFWNEWDDIWGNVYFKALEYVLWSIYAHAAAVHAPLIWDETLPLLKSLTISALSSAKADYIPLF